MKATTHFRNGGNHYFVYFSYEDYYGGETFRTFDEMMKEGIPDNEESKCGTLVGWLESRYWGSLERIDIIYLDERPTISQVKDFIRHCYDVIDKSDYWQDTKYTSNKDRMFNAN